LVELCIHFCTKPPVRHKELLINRILKLSILSWAFLLCNRYDIILNLKNLESTMKFLKNRFENKYQCHMVM
jgi:hypothetical protein